MFGIKITLESKTHVSSQNGICLYPMQHHMCPSEASASPSAAPVTLLRANLAGVFPFVDIYHQIWHVAVPQQKN